MQIVKYYVKESTSEIVEEIQGKIDAGYKVTSCSYVENDKKTYGSRALVIYEK